MALEDIFTSSILEWKSLILLLHILGVGYVGLSFIEWRRESGRIYDVPLFDKFIRSMLLGFLTFYLLLSILNIQIINDKDVLALIGGKYGLLVFVIDVLICIGISYGIHLLFYYLPKIDITIHKKL
ncbi:hypothetical protein HYY69_06365 [Candidatus Woesearchaeota archaeon]|nr:hypothetical protein [Candidatus Woesearchaeota archaeon]